MFQRFIRVVHERQELISIGIFGLAQMLADAVADLGYSLHAVVIRSLGIVFVIWVLVMSYRRHTTPLPVPLLFAEEESRENLRAYFDRFVRTAQLQKQVRELDALSPVQPSELYIRLSPHLRTVQDASKWEEAFNNLLHEWEREVDARLQRWLPGVHSGIIYHIRPSIVLPLAFALGYAVGLRRSIVLYHTAPDGKIYPVMHLEQPRQLFETPSRQIPVLQIPEDVVPPQQQGEHLILHLLVSDRHAPALQAHPDHDRATSVAIYLNQTLPEDDWLPYAQAIWAKASPWVNAFRQVDLCLMGTDALMFALGMAFSRTPHLRVCHWFGGQYLPVVDLNKLAAQPPFD